MAINITFSFNDNQQSRIEEMVQATSEEGASRTLSPAQILTIVRQKMIQPLKQDVLRYERKIRHKQADQNAEEF